MKEVLIEFIETLSKREEKGVIKIERDLSHGNMRRSLSIDLILYNNLNGLIIAEEERNIIFEIAELDSQHIKLASIGNVIIAFDCSKKNEADEWDIINYQSKYIITKTLSSFLNNKIWAWLDRKRNIWGEELYDNRGQND